MNMEHVIEHGYGISATTPCWRWSYLINWFERRPWERPLRVGVCIIDELNAYVGILRVGVILASCLY